MKNKNITKSSKTLILSAAAALAFGSVAVGTTYALFTSEAGTSVTVTSGKVSLKTEIKNIKLFSLSETTGEVTEISSQDTFTTGGTFSYADGEVSLDKIVPGDKVEFEMDITNESNVDIKYHKLFKVLEDTGLCAGLEMTIDGEAYDGATLSSEYVDWLKEDAGTPKTVKISIALPVAAGNAYQNKTCKLSFKYEAVQKNAKVETIDPTTLAIYTPTDLSIFAKKLETGTYNYEKTVLMDDLDMTGFGYASPDYSKTTVLEFDGNGHTIKNFSPIESVNSQNEYYTGLIGRVAGNVTINIHDVNFDNVTVVGGATADDDDNHRGAAVLIGWGDVVKSLVINNVSIKNADIKAAKYSGAAIGYCSFTSDEAGELSNITLDNVKTAGYTAGGLIGQIGGGGAKISGLKGTAISVDGYKREGGVVGALSGSNLDITIDETEYVSSISEEGFGNRGSLVGLTGANTYVNGNHYFTAIDTAQLKSISGLSSDKLNVIELAEGTYEAGGLTNFQNVAGGVKIVGRGDNEKVIWIQANASDDGFCFKGTAVTMENVTVKTDVAANYIGFPHATSASFTNCSFPITKKGEAFWYWGDGAVKFEGCKFDSTGAKENNMMAYGGTSFEFVDCDFVSDEAAIKLYQEAKSTATEIDVTITNCTFTNNHSEKWTDKAYKTALSFDTSSATDQVHWNVVAKNITVTGNYADGSVSEHPGLFGVRTPANAKKAHVSITLDGTELDLGLSE